MIPSFPLRRLLLGHDPSRLLGAAHRVYQNVAEMYHLTMMGLKHPHKSGSVKVAASNPAHRRQHIDGAAGKAPLQKTVSSSHLMQAVLARDRNNAWRIGSKDSQEMTLIAL